MPQLFQYLSMNLHTFKVEKSFLTYHSPFHSRTYSKEKYRQRGRLEKETPSEVRRSGPSC